MAFMLARAIGIAAVIATSAAAVIDVVRDVRGDISAGKFPATGVDWRAINNNGQPCMMDGRVGLRMNVGSVLSFDLDDARTQEAIGSIRVEFTRDTEKSVAELRFRDRGDAYYRLLLGSQRAQAVSMALSQTGESPLRLAFRNEEDFVGRVGTPVDARLQLDGPRITFDLGGETLVKAVDETLAEGALSIRVPAGRITVSRVHVEGTRDGEPYQRTLSFLGDVGPGVASLVRARLGPIAAALLLALLFVRALAGRSPSVARWAVATALLLLPPALATLAGVDVPPIATVTLLFAGALLSMAALRGHLDPAPVTRVDIVRRGIVVVTLTGVAVAAVIDQRAHLWKPWLTDSERASQLPPAGAFALDGERELNAASAVHVAERYRDFDLEAELTLEPGAVVELRMRARRLHGIAFFLSAHSELETGFALSRADLFRRIGTLAPHVAPERRVTLRIEARDRRHRAWLDGEPVADVSERLYPDGEVYVVSAAGRATLHRMELKPVASTAPKPSVRRDLALTGVGVVLALLLVSAAVACFLRLSWWRTLEPLALGLAPVALAFHHAPTRLAVPPDQALAAGLTVALVPVLLGTIHAARNRVWRFYAVLVVGVVAGVVTHRAATARAWPPTQLAVNALRPDEWSGDRLARDLVHVQHPLSRRLNYYLVDHRFRERRFSLDKPADAVRILALGTSSTYGYGSDEDYPTFLEELLNERPPRGTKIEVINAGWPGADGRRIHWLFRNALVDLDPDVVTLSLTYNDVVNLIQFDLDRYYEEITAPSFDRGVTHDLRERFLTAMGRRRLKALDDRLEAGEELLADWPEDVISPPPVRFERMLRDFAVLCEERGMRLVLIKEPMPVDRPFKAEFHQAFDRVGADHGVPVLDPWPAMARAGGKKLFSDPIHPYPEGHRVIAEFLEPSIREVLRGVLESR